MVLHHVTQDDPIFLFREIFIDNCYLSPSFYKPEASHTVLDVGANIGFFAVFLQGLARGIHIHCFEPGGDARLRLEQNVNANQLASVVKVHPVAVFDTESTLELKEATLSAHRSVFASEYVESGRSTSVQAIPLQKAIELSGQHHIDLLKIDVEGAEIEIAEWADANCWQQIERVVVEYHDLLRPGCKERVSRLLSARGYRGLRLSKRRPALDCCKRSVMFFSSTWSRPAGDRFRTRRATQPSVTTDARSASLVHLTEDVREIPALGHRSSQRYRSTQRYRSSQRY